MYVLCIDTNTYILQASLSKRVVVDGPRCPNFFVKAKENQDKFTMLYWLPKLHKNL